MLRYREMLATWPRLHPSGSLLLALGDSLPWRPGSDRPFLQMHLDFELLFLRPFKGQTRPGVEVSRLQRPKSALRFSFTVLSVSLT